MERDRISQLPEFIIHNILSLLDSPKELVRMSVLSEKWFNLTGSFPILDFNFRKVENYGIPYHCRNVIDRAIIDRAIVNRAIRESFFNYVAYTMAKFLMQSVSVHTFNFVTELKDDREVYVLDKCLGFILRRGVKVLVIEIGVNYLEPRPLYCLPDRLSSASSLTSLTICRCVLPSLWMVGVFKFKCLRLLALERVPLHDKVIMYLTRDCPLLEEIKLKYCYGFKRFCVYGHQNLQKVEIEYIEALDRIDIDASNLSFLYLVDWAERGVTSIKCTSCEKLTTVCYYGYPIQKSNGFDHFLSNFPFVENLFLTTLSQYNNLKLSSRSLKNLMLHSHCDLGQIEIDAPNLVLFTHEHSSRKPYPSWVTGVTQQKAHIECHPVRNVSTLWFRQLRRFLDKKNGFKVLKMLVSATFEDVKELKAIQSLPYELDHVDLEMYNIQELSVYLAVVEAVIWCCRPRSLTLSSNFCYIKFEERMLIVDFAYEKLLQQENGQTNIQIVLSPSFKAEKRPFELIDLNSKRDINSLWAGIPRDLLLTPAVTFTKKEVVKGISMVME